MKEAHGGEAHEIVGMQFGVTAGLLTYSYLAGSPAAFKMYPFSMAKTQGYSKIAMASVLFYFIGSSAVSGRFGDKPYGVYLFKNKSGILKGTTPWEKTE